jgi:hypothetical protein
MMFRCEAVLLEMLNPVGCLHFQVLKTKFIHLRHVVGFTKIKIYINPIHTQLKIIKV